MSKKHKFCFIHIEKNAGTSIRDAISSALKIPHFKSFWYFGPMRGKGGQRAIDYINLLGKEKYNTYFSFAFVRNPYDRLVSWFKYDNFGINTFEEWIYFFFGNIKLNQIAYLIDDKGEIRVDFIGKFENLEEDFNKVCDRLDVRHIKLPVKNKSKGRHYREYYTDKTFELVRKKLAEEIELFDYEY